MCETHIPTEPTKWQKTPPNSEGEWLWIIQWSCGCILQSGIASVWEHTYQPEDEQYHRLTNLNTNLWLSWEGNKKPLSTITAWQKIQLPPSEWHTP